MGFFYQAIKKATGETAEQEAQPVSVETPVAAVSPHAPAEAATAPKRSKLQRLALPHKLEKLVAVLSPPVLDGHVSAMEECRLLRSRIREMMRAKKHKTLMVTSSNAGEGKTLISVNLAYAMSQLENTRVLLMDADLRRPTVAGFLKISGAKG